MKIPIARCRRIIRSPLRLTLLISLTATLAFFAAAATFDFICGNGLIYAAQPARVATPAGPPPSLRRYRLEQWRSDARTLAAAISYLFEPERDADPIQTNAVDRIKQSAGPRPPAVEKFCQMGELLGP
jgi:hypothetical protein